VAVRLYDHQTEVVRGVYGNMRAGRRHVLAVMPTGAGKSVVAASVAQDAVARRHPVIAMVHRRELVLQMADHLVDAGLDPGLIMAGEKPDASKPVQVASVASLARREPPPGALVIDDEAHHSVAKGHMAALGRYRDAFWLGLTATPARLDGRGLGEAGWDVIVEGPTVRWLIENGYLARYDYWAPEAPELQGVRSRGGDFARGDAGERMGSLVGGPLKWYRRFLDGRQAIVFCATVEQSIAYEEAFNEGGVPCSHADASTPKAERDEIMSRFRSGEIRVLTNVQLVDEGFDVPECDGVILARPTKSLVFHRQSCGRALRPKRDGRPAVIVDMAGNASRCGLPDDPIEWTLNGKVSGDSVPAIRTCPFCFAVGPAGRKECPVCGEAYPVTRKRRKVQHRRGDLLQIVAAEPERVADLKMLYWSLLNEAQEKGWKLKAARVKFNEKTGCWPSRALEWVRLQETVIMQRCSHKRTEAQHCRFCGSYLPSVGTVV